MQELIDDETNGDLIIDNKHSLYIQHIDDHFLIRQRNIIRTTQEMTTKYEKILSHTRHLEWIVLCKYTLVSVIFLPLTFIAGIYGKNFVCRHYIYIMDIIFA